MPDPKTPRKENGQFAPGTSGNVRGRPREDGAAADPVDHPLPRADGWASAYTGIGTAARDKRLSHEYGGACLPYFQVAQLWEKNDVVAKAIEAPAAEVFREGYGIEINDEGSYDDLAGEIEERLEELGADDALEQAWQIKRAYGGSAILLGTKDSRRLDQPLDLERSWKLESLNVFEPIELVPVKNYDDPMRPKYGEPEFFELQNSASVGSMFVGKKEKRERPAASSIIHESRLIVFQGIKSSRYLPSYNQTSQFWGTSVVDRFIEQLRDMDVGFASAGLMATDISQPVITIESLMQKVSKDEQAFRDRMAALELGRSTARAVILDSKEKFERQTTNVSGVPDILDRLSIRTAAAIGIPLSVLLGYSPAALGQPGEAEMKLWYNIIRALQRREFSPILKRIAKMVMRSIRQRKIPKKWGIEWNELEHLNEMQRAEAELNRARADSMNIKSGMIDPNEARNSRWRNGFSFKTQIDNSKKAPGFAAPIPAGVLPGSTPGSNGAGGKPGAPGGKPAGPNAHSVTSYARRNPTGPALGANAKEGGDAAPGNRDSVATPRRDAIATFAQVAGQTELEYCRARLAEAVARGDEPWIVAVLGDLVKAEEMSLETAHGAGECDEECPFEHVNLDYDGPGEVRVFAGMHVAIESPRGSVRKWTDANGETGETKMRYDYGYFLATRGDDGDALDVYLGDDEAAAEVHVVHQMSKSSGFAAKDEDKVMLGFDSSAHARTAYLYQYDDERFFGGMTSYSVEDFRRDYINRPELEQAAA